jgi:hypothetical protein
MAASLANRPPKSCPTVARGDHEAMLVEERLVHEIVEGMTVVGD